MGKKSVVDGAAHHAPGGISLDALIVIIFGQGGNGQPLTQRILFTVIPFEHRRAWIMPIVIAIENRH